MMSFSKGRILRFNDLHDHHVISSPAHYKAMSCQVESSTITTNNKDAHSTSSENRSSASMPLFRTPSLPSRRSFKKYSSMRLKGLFASGKKSQTSPTTTSATVEPAQNERLKEKLVECQNKDQYIRELVDQLDELKAKLHAQRVHFEHVRESLARINDQLRTAAGRGAQDSCSLLADCASAAESERDDNVLDPELNMLQQLLRTHASIKRRDADRLRALKRALHTAVEQQERFRPQQWLQLKDATHASLDELRAVLQQGQFHVLTAMRKLGQLYQEQCDQTEAERVKIAQCEAKIRQLEENFSELNVLHEMQTKQKLADLELDWADKLKSLEAQAEEKLQAANAQWKQTLETKQKENDEILRECQEIGEYNIIESELEKNQIRCELADVRTMCDEYRLKADQMAQEYTQLHDNFQRQQNELSRTIVQLNEQRKRITEHPEYLKLVAEKRNYDIALTNTHQTIEAIKKRLLKSDGDVELLKAELDMCERQLLDSEKRVGDLQQEVDVLRQQVFDKDLELESALNTTKEQMKHFEEQIMQKVDEGFMGAVDFLLLQDSLNQLDAKFSNYESQFRKLNRCNRKSHEADVASLDGSDGDSLRHDYERLTEVRNELEQSVANKTQENEQLSTELRAYRDQCDRLRSENKELAQKYNSLKAHQQKIRSFNEKNTIDNVLTLDGDGNVRKSKPGRGKARISAKGKENVPSPNCSMDHALVSQVLKQKNN